MVAKNKCADNYSELYLDWLRQNIEQYEVSPNVFRITMPFLDRNNDNIEIYVLKDEDGCYTLTDDGQTLSELKLTGFNLQGNAKRKAILDTILRAHAVTLSTDEELTVSCNREDLPLRKHMLAQCIQKVSDLFYLSRPNVQSIFLDDVRTFLDDNNIRCMQNVSFVGISTLTATYDFAIAGTQELPDRLIKVVNTLNTDYAKSIIFNWNDTKQNRKHDSVLYAFIFDEEKAPSSRALTTLTQYKTSLSCGVLEMNMLVS